MNILHSCQTWLPQTQVWIHTQIKNLPPAFRCHVVCRAFETPELFPVERLVQIPPVLCGRDKSVESMLGSQYFKKSMSTVLKLGARLHDQLTLTRLARRAQARLVHSHFGPVGWRDVAPCFLSRAAHVVTFYGTDVVKVPRSSPRWLRRYEQLFAHVDVVLCEGEHMAQEIIALGCHPTKVEVHRLGIEVDQIATAERGLSSGEPIRVLMAASFREKKGYPYGLRALGLLRREFRFEVTIIGDGSPEARKDLEVVIGESGLGDRVHFCGFLAHSRMIEKARKHHIFLCPSMTAKNGDTEGGAPVILIDVMATGMPVVATRHCDIPNVVMDGVTGFLAPERDVPALAEQLSRMFRSHAQWPAMGNSARARVESEFNARVQGMRLGEIYQRTLDERRSGRRIRAPMPGRSSSSGQRQGD